CTGAGGEDLVLRVPVGTVVTERDSGELVGDLMAPAQRVLAVRGSHGGRGNARFATSTNQAPRRADLGRPGPERWLHLELKLLADVGVIGFPNAGKPTLVSRLSAARPRIADYPFTTLEPSLGVVDLGGTGTFVVADIPGLIEGSAEGAGLGHQFLRHLGRTRLLLHLVSLSSVDGEDIAGRYAAIREELRKYDTSLAERPEMLVLTKVDTVDEATVAAARESLLSVGAASPLVISAVTGQGIAEL